MATQSKFFRVALEGATTDGRRIERSTIEQMARTYNRAKYGARIFLEHLRGILPDGPFKAYGDVIAVKAEEVAIDGEKKLALFAQIEPTEDLVRLNKAGQKIFTSIEVAEKFAGGNEAYLVGLAITDSPASLGTEVLTFAAQHPEASPFTARKQSPDNLFTAAAPVEIEFEEVDDSPSLLERVKNLFKAKASDDDQRYHDTQAAIEEIATTLVSERAATAERIDALNNQCIALHADLQQATAVINQLSAQIDTTPTTHTPRPLATGSDGIALTNC